MAPRSIARSRYSSTPPPIRIYSDAAGAGGLASSASCPDSDAPFSRQPQAVPALDPFPSTPNKVFIFVLVPAVVTVFAHRSKLKDKKLSIFFDNGAACAVLARGLSKYRAAPTLFRCARPHSGSHSCSHIGRESCCWGNSGGASPKGNCLRSPAIISWGVPRLQEISRYRDSVRMRQIRLTAGS